MRDNKRLFYLLLFFLVALVVADGVITRFLVINNLGVETNPFLTTWVKSDLLLVIKLVGATLVTLILWRIYKRKPVLAWITASFFTAIYALIVIWNIIVFYIATGRIT